MGKVSKKGSLQKLAMDMERFYQDYNLFGRLRLLKLFLIVDFWPVGYYRMMEYGRDGGGTLRLLVRLALLPLKPLVEGISGARLYSGSSIGGGLLLHQSSGVVVAPGVEIGDNCTLYSGACVVYKANERGLSAPRIGSNVKLMVGCKVLGAVSIGDHVSVGANAVVLDDIPTGCIAVGAPARCIAR